MEIKIRPAIIEDLPAIQFLSQKLFEEEVSAYDPSLNLDWTYADIGKMSFQYRITENDGCVLIAWAADETPVGYICGGLYPKIHHRDVGKRTAWLIQVSHHKR
jgi:hypothetical protein